MSGGWEAPLFIAFGIPGGLEIPLLVVAAVLLFGSGKIRELARGLGGAKKEFMAGQAEAEVALERARAQARADAEAAANAASAPVTTPTTPTPPAPPAPPAPSV
jgi:TatA/E family protein of Tat protein translocase